MTQLWAQDRTVTGTVTDAANQEAVIGATVVLKGTTTGVTTNERGTFSIQVPAEGGTLVISYFGFERQEVAIGNRSNVSISLVEENKVLEEVVITALGVERETKALGYSVQEVQGAELSQTKETNLVNSLSGKVAGVQITSSSGAPGASSRIVIRGASSLLGNNQPLFVVDGIPLDNTQFSSSPRNSTNEPANGTRRGMKSKAEQTMAMQFRTSILMISKV